MSPVKAITIASMTPDHWEAVRSIYAEGITTGNATFETVLPDWQKWHDGHLHSCRLIANNGNEVVGWAALSPVSSRCVYGGVAEVSVYVAERARGQKIGSQLLHLLVTASEQQGFRVVGIRERLGCLAGRWRDVVLMERRSNVVGL